jgi:hypothetical protein
MLRTNIAFDSLASGRIPSSDVGSLPQARLHCRFVAPHFSTQPSDIAGLAGAGAGAGAERPGGVTIGIGLAGRIDDRSIIGRIGRVVRGIQRPWVCRRVVRGRERICRVACRIAHTLRKTARHRYPFGSRQFQIASAREAFEASFHRVSGHARRAIRSQWPSSDDFHGLLVRGFYLREP